MSTATVMPFEAQAQAQPLASGPVTAAASLAIALANLVTAATAAQQTVAAYTPEELLTFEQVGQVLGCSEQKARMWVKSYCNVVSIGNLPRVRRADLDVAIRRQAQPYGDHR